jgi:hypothetical protein
LSRPHAHPPEVCPAVDIEAHALGIRHASDVVSVLIGMSASPSKPPTFVVRTIERP